jgi:predicted PurR-regulated permease PerM
VNEEDVERILVKANKEQIGPKMAEDELPDEAAIAQLVERTKTIVKKYKERFYMLLVAVLILLGAVVFMFVITITSDSPTILNYKTKLENEYASWDEDLQKREDEVKHKEEELLKKAGQQQDNASEDK